MNIAIRIVGLVALLVVLALASLVIVGVPSRVVNALLGERISRAAGAEITVGGTTRLALAPLRVTSEDVRIAPADTSDTRIDIARITADITFASLMSGQPHATSVTLLNPVFRAPLLRDRAQRSSPPSTSRSSGLDDVISFERLTIVDGTAILADPVARTDRRIDAIALDAEIFSDRRVALHGSARLANVPSAFTAKTRLASPADRRPMPFEMMLDAPGILPRAISAQGDVTIDGALITLSNLAGRFGDEHFKGSLSADLAAKPALKVDLDIARLSFGGPKWNESRGPEDTSWSANAFDLAPLNYVDAQGKLAIGEAKIGDLRIAPAALAFTLVSGALNLQVTKIGIGSGEIAGDFVTSAANDPPDFALRADVTDVRALPLLSTLMDFEKLDGRMTAKLDLRGKGVSPRALAADIGGNVSVSVRDGEIVGLNLAQMIRSLTASTLTGWQTSLSEKTDLSELTASMRFDRGQGSTRDLMLAGLLVRMTGAGNVDLLTRTIAFRVEPKLVMSLQGQAGQGGTAPATPLGFGVPVVVQGPWAAPRIYPEMSGMLENPEAAYSQLRQLGQGLFGRDILGQGLPGLGGQPDSSGRAGTQGDMGQAIGTIIQSLTGRRPQPSSPDPAAPGSPPPPAASGTPSPIDGVMKQLFGR